MVNAIVRKFFGQEIKVCLFGVFVEVIEDSFHNLRYLIRPYAYQDDLIKNDVDNFCLTFTDDLEEDVLKALRIKHEIDKILHQYRADFEKDVTIRFNEETDHIEIVSTEHYAI